MTEDAVSRRVYGKFGLHREAQLFGRKKETKCCEEATSHDIIVFVEWPRRARRAHLLISSLSHSNYLLDLQTEGKNSLWLPKTVTETPEKIQKRKTKKLKMFFNHRMIQKWQIYSSLRDSWKESFSCLSSFSVKQI